MQLKWVWVHLYWNCSIQSVCSTVLRYIRQNNKMYNNNRNVLACKVMACHDHVITHFWNVKWCIIVLCVCSHNVKMAVKLKTEYDAVLHMPVLKEGKDRVSVLSGSMQGHQSYTQPGNYENNTACYPQCDNSRLIQNVKQNTNAEMLFYSPKKSSIQACVVV